MQMRSFFISYGHLNINEGIMKSTKFMKCQIVIIQTCNLTCIC
jgi:hypothetical protein